MALNLAKLKLIQLIGNRKINWLCHFTPRENLKNIKENEFCVDKLNLNLKVNSLNKEDTVDNIINQNLINIGVVV